MPVFIFWAEKTHDLRYKWRAPSTSTVAAITHQQCSPAIHFRRFNSHSHLASGDHNNSHHGGVGHCLTEVSPVGPVMGMTHVFSPRHVSCDNVINTVLTTLRASSKMTPATSGLLPPTVLDSTSWTKEASWMRKPIQSLVWSYKKILQGVFPCFF